MGKATLDELLNRATNGLDPNTVGYFRASDFYRLLHDPFAIWCDFHAPREEKVEEEDRHKELQLKQGQIFEEQLVKALYPNALKVEPDFGRAALVRTLALMLEGVPVIYQPHLWLLGEDLLGKGDVLIRDDSSSSDLGSYYYRVQEIKRSKDLRKYHKLQAASYHYMLSAIQGYTPPGMHILLEEKEKTISFATVQKDFLEQLVNLRDIRDGRVAPLPAGVDKTEPPWHVYANKILLERHDLTLLPGIGPAYRRKIQEKLGIDSVPEINGISENTLNQLLGPPTGTLAYHHACAYVLRKHIPVGKRQMIERRKRHLYFDIETSDAIHPSEPPHCYLIGAWDRERNKFVHFLGRGQNDEERIWREFLEYVADPKETCLYHWTDYELGEIDKAITTYPKLEEKLKLMKESCIDLKESVKQNYYIPVPTYSIKHVAPFLGFSWRQKGLGAFESMVLYWDWLEQQGQEIIEKVIKYNEDDCLAMLHIDRRLFTQP